MFEEGDIYAWNDILVDENIKKELIEMDKEILDMTIRDVSNMLGEQYEKNIDKGVPIAAVVMKGFNVQNAKRMMMQIILSEDIEEK